MRLGSKKEIDEKITTHVLQKNYPCVGALQAAKRGEIKSGVYEGFGTGKSASLLYKDLVAFSMEQKKSQSPYLTFWATYPIEKDFSEDEFERRLWQELSFVSGLDNAPWDPNFSDDPKDKKFCFSLGGQAYFVVGLHSKSSRLSRRFEHPSLVFNLYEQFEIITRLGQYESMVEINRHKDIAYQGTVNPMVEKHGDKWEAIQFSGRQNDDTWKCPFHRFIRKFAH